LKEGGITMKKFDMVIKNGTVIDGSGEPMSKADVGITDGKIAEIGDLKDANGDKIIDATGLYVAPGFIDSHSHSDWTILVHPTGDSKILQGITTDLSGLCGYAAAPIRKEEWWKMLYVRMTVGWSMHYTAAAYNSWPLPYGKEVEVDWSSMGEYLDRVEETGIGINYGMLFGHGSIRYLAMGLEARQSSEDELDMMKAMAEQAMKDGAFGMSSGLSGCPGCWASTAELVELSKVVAKYNGVYMTHQRLGEEGAIGGKVPVKETIEIAEKAGVRAVCSHIHVGGGVLELLDDARAKGIDITFDMFPYPGSIAGNIVYMLPHWLTRHRDQGFEFIIEQLRKPEVRERFKTKDYPEWIAAIKSIPGTIEYEPDLAKTPGIHAWDHMQLQKVWTTKNKKYIGKTFKEIAEIRGVDPWTAWFDIVCDEEGYARWMNVIGPVDSEDLYDPRYEECLKVPYGCVESDSPISSPRGVTITSVDPRAYGTFPLVLSEYIRKRKVISWEAAIQQMTSNPAKAIGLKDRGLLKKGYWADLCLFNPKTVAHRANFKNTLEMSQGINHNIYPEGIEYTIVNGTIVNEKGLLTGSRPGKVLRNGS
jgi:N-acyl-D-amino-acid deacylase